MKKILWLGLFLMGVVTMQAQSIMNGQITVDKLSVARSGDDLLVSMKLNVENLDINSEMEVSLTPAIVYDYDTLRMSRILIAGRSRFYRNLRNEEKLEDVTLYRLGKFKEIEYQTTVPYYTWMNYATVIMEEDICGCKSELIIADDDRLQTLSLVPKKFRPNFVYSPPKAEGVKMRELKGQAYIDFPVSRTEIYPEYRKNPIELQKIIATIDAVKNDPDTRITSVHIKGYASPESPYSNNTRLAKGRTETLKNYVQNLYHFPNGLITTDYEPEDWEGLREFVANSALEHKKDILALIDSSREPDNKEWVLKSRYPQQYAFLLREVYPGLRHSDYRVEYIVRSYTDVEEAKRVMRTSPGNLSLEEFYMVANSYLPGTEEYNETFEIMVRLYPDDATANLNAANVAMSKGDYSAATKYLSKAGNTREVLYAYGILAALQGDYANARLYFEKSGEMGVIEAVGAIKEINQLTNQ